MITELCALALEREWGTEENSRRPRGEAVLGEALVGGAARLSRRSYAVAPDLTLIPLRFAGYSFENEVSLSSKIEYDNPRK